jgi:hypothetical protein
MDPVRLGREYVLLGLACDRLVPGLVDCYVGPAEARRRVAAEPGPDPAALVARTRWLREELARSDLTPARADFLDRQLVALQCGLRRAAGAPMSYRAEVLAYFDTEVAPGEPDAYRAAHARLDGLLPGSGDLGARLAAFRARTRVPAAVLAPAVQRVTGALRERARATFDLPPAEEVLFELVSDRPWSAFHRYLGGHRSRVSVNAEIELGVTQLARLVAHETYPGHHVEHVHASEAGPDEPERTLFLLNTPQCLVSEGQADAGLEVLAGPDHRAWLPAALDGLPGSPGAELVGLAQRVDAALEALAPVRQDAALLLHDRGWPEAEASAHLRRWLLVDERRAGQMLRFLTHPRWRAYTTTYVEGRRLVGSWLGAGGPDDPVADRYLRLRRHPRSPSALRADLMH